MAKMSATVATARTAVQATSVHVALFTHAAAWPIRTTSAGSGCCSQRSCVGSPALTGSCPRPCRPVCREGVALRSLTALSYIGGVYTAVWVSSLTTRPSVVTLPAMCTVQT